MKAYMSPSYIGGMNKKHDSNLATCITAEQGGSFYGPQRLHQDHSFQPQSDLAPEHPSGQLKTFYIKRSDSLFLYSFDNNLTVLQVLRGQSYDE